MGFPLINGLESVAKLPHVTGFCDDFHKLDAVEGWVATAGSTGAATLESGVGGYVKLATAATDDDHLALHKADAAIGATPFYLGSGYGPFVVQSRFKLTEAATDQATFALGFAMASPASAEWTTKTAAPVTASLLFFGVLTKREGGTSWVFSSGSTADTVTNTETTLDIAVTTAQFITAEILVTPDAVGAGYNVSLRVDPAGGQSLQPAYPSTGNVARLGPVQHFHKYRTAGAVYVGAEVRAGSAAIQTAHIDYIAAYQVR